MNGILSQHRNRSNSAEIRRVLLREEQTSSNSYSQSSTFPLRLLGFTWREPSASLSLRTAADYGVDQTTSVARTGTPPCCC
jgi:hypothetical protein